MCCVWSTSRVCTVVQQSIDPHLHAMPAPSQRSDDALLRREARESAEQRERERQAHRATPRVHIEGAGK